MEICFFFVDTHPTELWISGPKPTDLELPAFVVFVMLLGRIIAALVAARRPDPAEVCRTT